MSLLAHDQAKIDPMSLRVAFLGVAHMHSYGYGAALRIHPEVEVTAVFDPATKLAEEFAGHFDYVVNPYVEVALASCDAAVITSENARHHEFALAALKTGKHVLCEKPLVIRKEDGEELIEAAKDAGVVLMTAFPCRYSPAYKRLKQRVQTGEIGEVKAICATNRGSCPFSWFVEQELSGGGAMIDHVVHVTDLLRDLLQSEVTNVQAQTGHNIYSQAWEDTAMLTLEFANGVFATLDSSWSRHASFKTWGDVTLTVVGERGVIEMDMFAQAFDVYRGGTKSHCLVGYGSDLDQSLVEDFVNCCFGRSEVTVSGIDGLRAVEVALKGYESAQNKAVVAAS